MSKIIKNVRDINREGCGGLDKCVRRQDFKDPHGSKDLHGSKPVSMFRDTFFTLPNLTLLNLISLGVPHSYMLSYGLYQI
jgi:hypothetical protein